jgi:pimeloyl-ACP methyl ester carboxylesterase
MALEIAAGTRDETPVFFDTGGDAIFGIVTRPTTDPLNTVMIVLSGGGTPVSTNRNRLSVRLCRSAADLGFHAVRFDYHGVGESEGSEGSTALRIDQPYTADLMQAVDWARRSGLERVVLIGSCFGARTALASSPRIAELAGIALLSAPVRDLEMGERAASGFATGLSTKEFVRRTLTPKVVRGLFEPDTRKTYRRIAAAKWRNFVGRQGAGHGNGTAAVDRATRRFVDPLAELIGRKVPTLLMYGSDESLLLEFERARTGRLGDVLTDGSDTIEIVTLPGTVHGFTSIAIQELVLDSLTGWLGRLAADIRATSG